MSILERPELVRADARPAGFAAFIRNRWTLRALGLVAVLSVWQFAFARVNPIFSAPPTNVVRSIPEILADPDYFPAMLSTLRLFVTGFTIAAVLGILIGLALARFRLLDMALTPYLNAIYASPLPAIVPILTAIMGYRLVTKVVIVVLLAVFPILINVYQGAKSVDVTMLEVARSFRVGEARLWWDVICPRACPTWWWACGSAPRAA